jgi:N-acetylmuramoyl-L-alanine amidase
MRVKDFRLVQADGKAVKYIAASQSGGALTRRFLVMHYTAGGSGAGTASYFAGKQAKASAHLVIDRDGTIIQQVEFDTVAFHAGVSAWKGLSGLNRHSIGIELANWGQLSKSATGFKSYTGVNVPPEDVVFGEHKNFPGKEYPWEAFPSAQFEAAVAAASAICSAYDIPEEDIIGHDDIAPNRKIDPGPAFAMALFRSRVSGRMEDGAPQSATYRVASPTGLNLRAGPAIDQKPIKLLPDGALVRLIERGSPWWLVAEINAAGQDDVTGYVHSHWLVGA